MRFRSFWIAAGTEWRRVCGGVWMMGKEAERSERVVVVVVKKKKRRVE